MKYKRAVATALIVYIVVFIIGMFSARLFNIDDLSSAENISYTFWAVGVLATLIFTWIGSEWYFHSPLVKKKNIFHGLRLGLIFICTWIIFDFITVFFTVDSGKLALEILSTYYKQMIYWVTSMLAIVITVIQSKRSLYK